MKKAGDILSALFDERFVKEARGYSKLFDSWTDITAKNGIAAAADYSKIKELDKGMLFIEVVHPGWKQILQTKQSKLLNDFRRRFPQLDISGISLLLGKPGKAQADEPEPDFSKDFTRRHGAAEDTEKESERGLNAIKDEEFKEKLIRLGKNVTEREKNRTMKR